jgi:predicted TIM-barrel fold metal-dependent hydrolase
MHLDLVCFRFPELKLCMAHGADPWWGVAIRLMIKYKNLHLMTSAYSPKRLPADLLHFMNTRGQDKIIWASDHPALTMQRTIAEAWELDLREGVLDNYLYANADRLFFSRLK